MKEDITRKAIERSLSATQRALAEMERQMPFGPNQVQMSPAELQKNLRNAKGETLLALMSVLGEAKVMEMLRDGSPTRV